MMWIDLNLDVKWKYLLWQIFAHTDAFFTFFVSKKIKLTVKGNIRHQRND